MGLTVRVPREDDFRSPVFKKGAPRVISSVALVRWLLVGAVFVLSIVYFNGDRATINELASDDDPAKCQPFTHVPPDTTTQISTTESDTNVTFPNGAFLSSIGLGPGITAADMKALENGQGPTWLHDKIASGFFWDNSTFTSSGGVWLTRGIFSSMLIGVDVFPQPVVGPLYTTGHGVANYYLTDATWNRIRLVLRRRNAPYICTRELQKSALDVISLSFSFAATAYGVVTYLLSLGLQLTGCASSDDREAGADSVEMPGSRQTLSSA